MFVKINISTKIIDHFLMHAPYIAGGNPNKTSISEILYYYVTEHRTQSQSVLWLCYKQLTVDTHCETGSVKK